VSPEVRRRALFALAYFTLALTPPALVLAQPAEPVVVADKPALHDGAALAIAYECNRCHEGAGLEQATADKACVGCHTAIHSGRFEAPPDVLAHWQKTVVDLTAVPSLDASQRLRRSWVRDFLLRPHDLRPNMSATMPRLDLDPPKAEALARWLVPGEDDQLAEKPDPRWLSWPSRGRRIMERTGCMTCHVMTGLEPGISPTSLPVPMTPAELALGTMLAPDLALVRTRLREDSLVSWLMDPRAVKPASAMPSLGLSRTEAEDVAAYLLEVSLKPAQARKIPERLPVLDRRVPYKEVQARVFQKVCWHCHSEADLALGDGGPGNTGGLGFEPRGLNLRDYASIAAGSIGPDGSRRSVFKPLTDGPMAGTPRILAHMLARQVEEAGGVVEGIRGMPLGLPAFSPEDIQLVESWIVQGRPE
jgi:mono/diheme cytochrome c family protein